MKLIGSILLAVGFLSGAYVTVANVAHVDWMPYGFCAAFMFVGLVLLHRERASHAESQGEKHDEDINVLERTLAFLIEKVRAIESDSADEQQLGVYKRIDAELMESVNTFVEARESMIPRLGMETYADVMSAFANAERNLNRAWSASADGYVDEVRRCIGIVRTEFEMAAELLKSSQVGA